MHTIDEDFQELVEEMIEDQKENWELAKKNYEALEENLEKQKNWKSKKMILKWCSEFSPNPQTRPLPLWQKRIPAPFRKRPCFLCEKNRPAEQTSLPFGHYEI